MEGGDDDDIDNIDFANYKGIYAEDDTGQKYTCPETGAHFEPSDLCRRIYKIIENNNFRWPIFTTMFFSTLSHFLNYTKSQQLL